MLTVYRNEETKFYHKTKIINKTNTVFPLIFGFLYFSIFLNFNINKQNFLFFLKTKYKREYGIKKNILLTIKYLIFFEMKIKKFI